MIQDEQDKPNLRTMSTQNTKIPQELFPEDRRKYIAKLNQALQTFVQQPSSMTNIKDLWKWYSHSRNNLSSAWHLIPSSIWTILWEAFSREGAGNPHRMAHIKKLGEDMKSAGAQLDRPQTLLFVESLFLEGSCKEAISQWESSQTVLAYDTSTAGKYWALGAQLLAIDNQSERAEQAMDILVNGLNDGSDPRALIPVIRSWLETEHSLALQRAWAIYVRLKHILGSDMDMRDYDAVAGAFLAAQHTDLALAVFRDMMLTGHPSACDLDSIALYKRTFKTVGDLQSFKLTPNETGWKSHDSFTALPRENQNKYYYGSWIKKLIGDGQVDWAAQVAGLMYKRGIVPDPKHINGIIGAWLRSGTPQNQQKAEDLAWKMIGARIDFVQARDHYQLERPLRVTATSEKKGFERPSTFLHIPTLATVETFCILINYYQRRRRGDRVQEICGAIKAAKIKPNTSFLNDLLLVGAIQNRKQWAWNAYNQLVNVEEVRPDHDTFSVLWQMMQQHLHKPANVEFPLPRILFLDMTKLAPSGKKGTLSREAYELILNCFILADDQLGTFVALRAMQRLFDVYPSDDTVRNMVLELAKTGHRKVVRQLPRRQERVKDMQSRLARVTEALNVFKERRAKALLEKSITFENMDDATKSEEVIMLLGDLLLFAVRSGVVHPNGEPEGDMNSVRLGVQLAAEEMGVPQCIPDTLRAMTSE